MPCPEPSALEQAIGTVHAWEFSHFPRLLETYEAVSLIQAIAHQLVLASAGRLEACTDGDFLRDAYAVVNAWAGDRTCSQLNAVEAATLADSIALALENPCIRISSSLLAKPTFALGTTHAEQQR